MTFEELQKANEQIKTTAIKGKNYAEVNQRIKAFRMLHPNGCIHTDIISLENEVCIIKATILDEDGNELGTGTAYEKEGSTFINQTSYIENCETSAVGRALGMVGIGIDVSVASYEEVSNAIAQQEEEKTRKSLIDQPKKTVLINTIKKKGVEVGKVLERYELKSVDDMTLEEWMKAMKALEKMKDVE